MDNTRPGIYAVLLQNSGTKIVTGIDPTRSLVGQVEDSIVKAAEEEIGSMIVPPYRNCEVVTSARWRVQGVVGTIFCLEWALSIDDLKVNRPAWYHYGRSPIVGPAVIALDSNEDGTLNEIPRFMLEEIRRALPHKVVRKLAKLVGEITYGDYQGRWV